MNWMTGMSRSVTALTRPWPMPGKSKTSSTRTMPPARRKKVSPTTWIVGGNGIGKGVLNKHPPTWETLQAGHLDIGRLERLERGGSRHPVDVWDRHDDKAERRQHEQAGSLKDVLARSQKRHAREEVEDHS